MKLVLASASARRKELLGWLGIPFEVQESGFDESGVEADTAELLVSALALAKAQAVADQIKAEKYPSIQLEKEVTPQQVEAVYVLGGDTIVALKDEFIGKPRDLSHAREILQKLRGKTHEVYSGVALVEALTGRQKTVTDKSAVTFRNYSDEELEDYLATSESLGKAGAYMLNGKARVLVEDFSGSITNVIGLPLLKVVDLLENFGIGVKVDVGKTVRKKTGYLS